MKKKVVVLKRSLSLLCPQCGKSKIFQKLGALHVQCPRCGCALLSREQDTWFFMYMSTAVITGIFLLMLFPAASSGSHFLRALIVIAAFVVFIVTLPYRKSLAIGLEFLADSSSRIEE